MQQHPAVPSGLYRHYKGKDYFVFGVAHHSETEEALVVYETRYPDAPSTTWVRPLKMFIETVMIDGHEVPRFRRLS
jgi:hypothetical protein